MIVNAGMDHKRGGGGGGVAPQPFVKATPIF